MCSCSTKERASLVREAEAEGEAEKGQAQELAGAEAEVTGKCNGVTTWPLH